MWRQPRDYFGDHDSNQTCSAMR
ncbi:hypothetical protein RHECNPAF_730066 [Rhizobium etli CNPAF512]|nr:hypothetical protein RHECNPAF_730066 [Rhizobium etli CNPAF512]